MTKPSASSRWEWRTFAPTLINIERKIGKAATVCATESSNVYIVSARVDLNLKIRGGALELKRLDQIDTEGLELWRPAGKLAFPAPAASITTLISPLALSLPTSELITSETFLSYVGETADMSAVVVRKRRRSFHFEGCLAELTDVETPKRKEQTLCVESESPAFVLAALKELDLSAHDNLSFPRWLRRHSISKLKKGGHGQ